ncbi:MAG: YraN family protein [Corynebacterium sp.]|nr:YraN family protein [Corynebacterium sp.]
MSISKGFDPSLPPGKNPRPAQEECTPNQLLGALGEYIAVQHYDEAGYRILDLNAREGRYEIDIVALSQDMEYVFIEVKTRRSRDFGGLEAVTPKKLRHMQRAALGWMARRKVLGAPMRFDLAEVIVGRHRADITLVQGVDS